MAENQNISDDELLAAFKGEQPTASYPVYSKKEATGISDEEMLSAFKGTSPEMQTSGGTLSGGGGMFVPEMLGSHAPADESSLVKGGALGSGSFAPYSIKVGKFDPYAGITDPATRKGLAETVFSQITDPQELDELQKKVPWYNMSENPVQTDSLFQYKYNKASNPFELASGAAEAGLGMLTSLPPLVLGAGRLGMDAFKAAVYAGDPTAFGRGRTLTEEQKKGLSDRQIQDAELSDRDKLIRSSRAFGDAALETEEQLRTALVDFAEAKSMLWDKARVNTLRATANLSDPEFTPAISIEEENARRDTASAQAMVDARRNFEKRLNAKHVEFLQREKNPAVLAREIEAVWKYPAVKSFAADVVESLMPSAEDIQSYLSSGVPGFGGDFAPVFATQATGGIDVQTAKALRRAEAVEAAEAGVQAMIAESNRLREDPEQVGAIAMTTPLNIFGAGAAILGGLGKASQGIRRGLEAVSKTAPEINAARSAQSAATQTERANAARALEQPGWLEKPLGSIADTFDKAKAAIGDIPLPAQYAGMAALGGIGGAVTSEDPLAGFVKGAGAGAAGRLGMKLGGEALLNAPRLGQELLKAGRLSGAEMGRFEALEKLGSASPEVQRFVNWSQKAGGGQALDFIEKNANVFVQHNISMLPMMVAMGVLEDKDAQEFAQMWAEFATYGFIHGQVLGGILGNDPVRARMDRDAQMRQAQRIMLASSPETRSNLTNLNWDRVVEQSQARVEHASQELAERTQEDPNSPDTAKAKQDYQFALRLHNENLTAPPEARAMFEDGIKLSLAKVSNMINGVLTPNSNMNIELLTREQIIEKMIEANPSYNGPGLPMTEEQALERNPGADGAMISKGKDKSGFSIDPARDTVFINIDNALQKSKLSGESIANTLAHEAVGHGLFSKKEYRESIAPLYNKLFGTEIIDENGNWKQVSPSEPGLSREDLIQKFFTKYLGGKNPQEVASYAKASGVWDQANDTFNTNKIVELMREEVLAEAHAGRFFGDPESPLQRGIGWVASRVSGRNLRAALNHLYSVAGPAVYQQWTSGVTGATYSPEVMRAIRNVESQMKKYDGDFIDAEKGEAVAAPITKKDVMKSNELLQKYFVDTGKFETKPIAIVTDAQGNVVQSVPLRDNEAFEGSWNFHEDDATGSNLPNRERGFGDIPLELAGVQVPVGGRLQVQRQIAYDEATGKPIERKNKATVEYLKRRVQMLRDAIDNAGDQSQLGRFRAVGGKEGDEDLHYTGKLTAEQRAAVAGLPESVVPASIKELLFKYDDLMSRGDGTVLDIDYASRLNDKGNYQAFSPKVRQIVPLQLHLSKAGNFYTTAWDISDLRRKVRLYEKYAKGVFEPWGGDTQKFWNEFRTILLPNLTNADPSVPGWQGLDADPNVAKLKRTIYEKMLGAPNPNVPNVESIPDLSRDKFSRSERKLDKQSSFDQIIKSFRLDSVTAAEENANSAYKYPIPYKARFMPEQEVKPEDQRAELPAVFEPSILKGLRSINASYMGAGAPTARLPLDTAETFVTRFKPRQNEEDAMVSHGFYSKAGTVLLDKMPNRASAAQLKGILDPQKGSGVKPEELKFSGINQFIDAKQAEKGFVTKDDIRKWLKEDYAAEFATQTEFGDIGGTQYDKYALPGGENYKEVVLKVPGTKFKSSHFADVPNYVAHLRTAEHGTGLLVEEMQSDLHQKAREKGYKEPIPVEELIPKMESDLANLTKEKERLFEQYKEAGQELRSMPGVASELTESQKEQVAKLREFQNDFEENIYEINAAIEGVKEDIAGYKTGERVTYRGSVPDAPFRKDWPLQLFKYALKDAVEAGKEWVGWTAGEAQADRYSLANKIDTLAYDTVNQKLIASRAGNRVFDKNVPTSEVSNYVGKEIAEKLLSSKDRGNGMRMIYPEDMKIGGEGMKGFYDVMLPKEIGKYVKQWGATVEPGVVNVKKIGKWQLFDRDGDVAGTAYSEKDAQNFATQIGGSFKQTESSETSDKIWKIAITPEMRESVAGGQTRFMPSVAVVPERFTGTGEEEQRRGRYIEPPKAFKRFDISQYEPGGKFFDAETGEDLTNKSYENASIAVVNGKPMLVANNEAESTGTGPLFKTNLFKQKAGWKWVSEGAPDTSTIVSVEGQGKHLYALQADFQNGVKMARYEGKASEPRLRPTGRGELTMGEQIGTIDIRGREHPVYDRVTIGAEPESATRFSPAKLDSEYTAAFEAKDEEKARELVDQAAKQAGYTYKVYRGVENDYIKGDGYVFGKADQTYFTGNRALADTYANFMGRNPEGVVYDTYLRLENPFIPEDINDAANFEYDAKRLREKGYDGVIGSHGGVEGARNGQVDVAVAFDPSQIKSADPFTYDNAGRLIPLSERFNVGTGDIRFMPAKEGALEGIQPELKEEERRAKKNTSLRVKMTREALTDAALSQENWRNWYSEHQETLDDFFGKHAGLFQNILAITSQAASVKANVGLGLKAFGQLMRGEDFDGYLPAVAGNLAKLRDETGPGGQKIQAFTAANEGDTSSVVVDRHISRMLFGVDTPSAKQFAKASKVLTEVADKIGWTPAQVQAALWAHSIVQSGKQPQSYGSYLKQLESRPLTKKERAAGLEGNQLTRRIGGFGEGSAGVDATGRTRGRYSPDDSGSLSGVEPVAGPGGGEKALFDKALTALSETGVTQVESVLPAASTDSKLTNDVVSLSDSGGQMRFMPLGAKAQAELSPEEKQRYVNFTKGNWTEIQDAPKITMHDLIGRKVFPAFADLTSGGRIYKGIDSSEIAVPIETHGGPEWPLIQPEKVGEETNVWSNQGAGVSTTKANRANERAVMLVTAMDKNAHISNTEVANAIISTNVAYARDKRLDKLQVESLDARIKEEMPDFPGIQSPDINVYVSKLPFQGDNSRARLAKILSQKDAEDLGAVNVQRVLDEMRAPSYEGARIGEAVLAIELTPGAPVVKLGESGSMTHPSYQYAVRGRVIGRLERPMALEMIYKDYLNARRAAGSPESGDRRSIALAMPTQLITQEIADAIPQTKYQNIKSSRHAQVLAMALNNEWRSSVGKVKDGAVAPSEFINSLNASEAKIALDKYTLPEITKKIKAGEITLHQLGSSEVFFATKPGDPATGYGKNPKDFGFGENEKTLSLVLNGERGTAGMGDAIVMKALQEGVTALDCFAVKSSKYPDGMLPALYGRFGFETVGEIPFDPSYYTKLEVEDLKRFWKKNGWDESTGYPAVVLMKWKGNESQRTSTLLDLAGQSSAGIRGRAATIVGDARSSSGRTSGGQSEGSQRGSGEGDTGRGGGSEGAALQGVQLGRGTVGAVGELLKMSPDELRNLGINPESFNK